MRLPSSWRSGLRTCFSSSDCDDKWRIARHEVVSFGIINRIAGVIVQDELEIGLSDSGMHRVGTWHCTWYVPTALAIAKSHR